MHDHNGHRQRVITRFRKEGLDSFDEVHALELMLFYIRTRIDTKTIARSLLDRFGSFPLVLEATQEELMTVPGVGPETATYIRLINELGRYYAVRRKEVPTILDTVDRYKQFLWSHFRGRRDETVFLLCLDAKKRLLNCAMVNTGDKDAVLILPDGSWNWCSIPMPPLRFLRTIILPDWRFLLPRTFKPRCLLHMLGKIDCILLDHVIFSDDDVTSMVESYMYTPKAF